LDNNAGDKQSRDDIDMVGSKDNNPGRGIAGGIAGSIAGCIGSNIGRNVGRNVGRNIARTKRKLKRKFKYKLNPKLRNALIIAKKDARNLLFEKTLLLAVLIQLFIASFSSFLVVGLTTFYDPSVINAGNFQHTKLGVVTAENISISNMALIDMLQKGQLDPRLYNEFSAAGSAFFKREIDGIILLPNVGIDDTDRMDVHIYLPESDFKSTITIIQLKEPFEKFEQFARDYRTQRLSNYAPIKLNDLKPRAKSSYFEFVYVVLLPLLLLTPAFISGGLIIDFLTEEIETNTLDLLMVAPLSMDDIVNGKVLLAVGLAPVQSFIWILLMIANGIAVHHILLILYVVTVITAILVLVGAAISLVLKDRGMAQMLYSLVLIVMFLASYLFVNSPMNLIIRLAIDSLDVMALVYLIVYGIVVIAMARVVKFAGNKF